MTEINDFEKEKIQTAILNSSEFRDSKRYQDLLKYLIEKSEKDGSIKEIEIAIDVFGKDSSFDPNTNPLIRSYISNLRKKLEHYYLTTEDQYAYRLEVPKGQYLVNYIHTAGRNESKKTNKYIRMIYPAIIILLILFITYQQFEAPSAIKSSSRLSSAPNPVWREFLLVNSQPTIIVLGDYLFMAKKNDGTDRMFLRNTKINSEKQFQQYEEKYPGIYSNYEISKFTYLRPSASLGLLEVLRVLGNSNKNVSIKLASQLKWEDLEKHNIIFLGTFKTLYQLDTLITQTNLRFNVEPSSLKIIGNNADTVKSFEVSWISSNYQNDYSVLLKMPGSKNNTMLFCLGFSEIGVMDAINSAVDPNFVPRIQKFLKRELPKPPVYFEMVSRCEGIEMTALKSEINYFEFLPAQKNN